MTQQFNSTAANSTRFVYQEPCSAETTNKPPCFKPKCSTCMYRNNCANFVGESIWTPENNPRVMYE